MNYGGGRYGSGGANLNMSDQNFNKKASQGPSVHASLHNITQSSNMTRGHIDSTAISDNHPKSRVHHNSGIAASSNFGSQNKLGQDNSLSGSSYTKAKSNVVTTMHQNLMEPASKDAQVSYKSHVASSASTQGLAGGPSADKKMTAGGGAAAQGQMMQKDQQLKQLC